MLCKALQHPLSKVLVVDYDLRNRASASMESALEIPDSPTTTLLAEDERGDEFLL